MSECTVLWGGHHAPAQAAQIADGRHPRVEFREFLNSQDAEMLSFNDLPAPSGALANRAGPFWRLAARARRRRGRFVLATGEDVGLPLALLGRLSGDCRPVHMVFHGSFLGSRKGALALRLLRSWPYVHFLCLSETLRQRLIRNHGFSPTQARNGGYGVDTRFFAPSDSPIFARQIASAGTANRDYTTLIAATRGLNSSVKIAADSAWYRLETDIQNLTLPADVEARSYGDYVGLRQLYAESAIVVVPLRDAVHACGYAVIAEAMAMGKPVIATRTGSHSDFIQDGETGFYVPPGDADALRARLAELLDQPERAAEMGKNARRWMEAHGTLDAYQARLAKTVGLTPTPRALAESGRT